MTKKFNVIYADPPWGYGDDISMGESGARNRYKCMTTEEISLMKVQDIGAEWSMLFLWATWPMLLDAIQVMWAWEHPYKTVAFVWNKTNKDGSDAIGMGHYTRSQTEIVLLGTRGKPPEVISHSVYQGLRATRGFHSEKPDEVRTRIVDLVGDVSRIELFARVRTRGWDCWGEEVESDLNLIPRTTGARPVSQGLALRFSREEIQSAEVDG